MSVDHPRRRLLRNFGIGCAAALVGVRTTIYRRPTGADTAPRVIGHRGCALEAVENSLSAVEHAAETADAVEVDVRRVGSDELVVIHDERVDRVTDGRGPVDELSLDELQEFTLVGTAEPVPTLEAVFEAVPPSVPLVLDLKERGLVGDVLELAAEYDHSLLLSSFLPSVVANASETGLDTALIVRESWAARRFRGTLARTIPVYPRQPVDQFVSRASELECTAIHPRLELCLRTALVERAHEAGLLVEPWTTTSAEAVDEVAEAGVDGIISDVCQPL